MGGEGFIHRVEKRLVPTFRVPCPGEAIVLIFDHSPYHHGIADGCQNPLKVIKSKTCHTSRLLGVSLITGTRGNKQMKWDIPASGAVSLEGLRYPASMKPSKLHPGH